MSIKIYKDIRLKQGTEEWRQWRYDTGIGGSEIASVLATDSFDLSQLVYTPPLKLFLQKIGEPVQGFTGNISSEEGKFQEKQITHRFKFYDLERPDNMLMHKNMKDGLVLNKVIHPGNVWHNPNFEWLFYSPDAVWVLPDELNPRKYHRHAILESKLTNSMETARYKNRVNPSHYLQVMTGLMITGLPIGYVLLLIDGQFFEPVPVYPDKEVFQWIEQISAQFWTRVVKARKIKIEYQIPYYFGVNPDHLTQQQRDGAELLSQLEPELIGSEHEMAFIREMIIPKPEECPREGTDDEFALCQNYLEANENITKAEAKKREVYERLLMSLNGSNMINFPGAPVKGCYYSYMPDKNGKASIRVSQKIKQL